MVPSISQNNFQSHGIDSKNPWEVLTTTKMRSKGHRKVTEVKYLKNIDFQTVWKRKIC